MILQGGGVEAPIIAGWGRRGPHVGGHLQNRVDLVF